MPKAKSKRIRCAVTFEVDPSRRERVEAMALSVLFDLEELGAVSPLVHYDVTRLETREPMTPLDMRAFNGERGEHR